MYGTLAIPRILLASVALPAQPPYRDDAEGAAGLVRNGGDPLRVADHLAHAVARVPHEALGAALLAVAHDDDALRLRVPVQVDDLAAEGRDLHLEDVLRVVPRPHPHLSRIV